MKLAETQRVFWHLATRSPSAEPQSARELFVGTSALDADSRISIYADMYFWRQIDSLREDFPKLAALLGDEGFHQVAEQYVRAHPSEHPDLGQLGRKVAAFMAERAGPRPDLADLAALEWARAEVFDEAHAEPAEMQLGGPDSRLRLAPALRLLALRHDVLSLWSALEEDRPPPPPRAGATHVAVWRKGFIPMHAAIDADEALALSRARTGAPLAEICDAFADRPDAIAAALRAVGSWFAEGWIAKEDVP